MKAEDFRVVSDRDGEQQLQCADYAEGCWWDIEIGAAWNNSEAPNGKLGELMELARKHIAESHS